MSLLSIGSNNLSKLDIFRKVTRLPVVIPTTISSPPPLLFLLQRTETNRIQARPLMNNVLVPFRKIEGWRTDTQSGRLTNTDSQSRSICLTTIPNRYRSLVDLFSGSRGSDTSAGRGARRLRGARETRGAREGGQGGGPKRNRWDPSKNNRFTSASTFLTTQIGRVQGTTIVYILIGLNACLYLAWWYAEETWKTSGDPKLLLFMRSNFTTSAENLSQGRVWTLVTSCFSHKETSHFMFNMLSLALTAPAIVQLIGPSIFLGLYCGTGIAASMVSGIWNTVVEPWLHPQTAFPISSHGASGSVYGILSTFVCIQPRATFLLFFVIPVPAWLCIPGLLAYDLYSATTKPHSRVDNAAHVGGILSGFLFWFFRLRGIRF